MKNKSKKIEHKFLRKDIYSIYRSILKCEHCKGKFYSDKVYMQCQECQLNFHKSCAKTVLKNCSGFDETGSSNFHASSSNKPACVDDYESNDW